MFLPVDTIDGAAPPLSALAGARTLSEAERRLMADVLMQAVQEARASAGSAATVAHQLRQADRDAARAWLRAQPGFTARECCEALGVEYEAMMAKLEAEWRQTKPKPGPKVKERAASRGTRTRLVVVK